MALLFAVSVYNISLHIKNFLREKELGESVAENSSVTASNGKNTSMQKMHKTKRYIKIPKESLVLSYHKMIRTILTKSDGFALR